MAGPAKATSKLRRLHRWRSNPLVDVAAYYRPFVQAAMAGWAGKDILLIVDGTSPKGACVVCRASVCFRGRAFPLCWQTFDTKSHSISYARYVAVLELARTLLPAGCSVTLLGDRGFGHRKLMKWCRKAGWDSLLRLKADSTVILPDGSRRRLDAWKPRWRLWRSWSANDRSSIANGNSVWSGHAIRFSWQSASTPLSIRIIVWSRPNWKSAGTML
jgi:hypothetical protein